MDDQRGTVERLGVSGEEEEEEEARSLQMRQWPSAGQQGAKTATWTAW